MERKTVLIVGGGFVGIRAALDLAKQQQAYNLRVVLVGDRPHFEYHATLYRVVTGKSPLQSCIPLREIFAGTDVELLEDYITSVDLEQKVAHGAAGFAYHYDYLVLGLGAETTYFGIPGLDKYSQGFKTIPEAIRLKRRFHELIDTLKQQEKPEPIRVAVIGAGPSGTELSAELVGYIQELAKHHQFDPSLFSVNLIEAAPRVLPAGSARVSARVLKRLHALGVNVFLNSAVTKETYDSLHLKDMLLKTRLVVWTSGVTPNRLYSQIPGLTFDKRRRVEVDAYLQPKGLKDVFVGGDAASTQYAGMAQVALYDGAHIAAVILAREAKKKLPKYDCPKPIYSTPVGTGWAATAWGSFTFYGSLGWSMRRAADLRFYKSILPLSKASVAYDSEMVLSDDCPICSELA